jgi:hypothetical protein
VRRLILVIGAVLLIAGVICLFMPVSVSGDNDHVGCGSAAASDLSAAHAADNRSGANIPVLSQVLPHTDYVSQCQSSLSTRRRGRYRWPFSVCWRSPAHFWCAAEQQSRSPELHRLRK